MQGMVTTKTPNLSQNLLKKETFGAIAELHQVRSCGPCLCLLAQKSPKLAKKIKAYNLETAGRVNLRFLHFILNVFISFRQI